MKLFERLTLMKVHAILAAFILPVAIMFFITGGLYTWGIKGAYEVDKQEFNLQKPLEDDLVSLVNIAKQQLKKLDIEEPSGEAKIKRIGSSFKLEWTGSNIDVILKPSSKSMSAVMEIKHTTWHRRFVQLHKAKGGTPFKIYAAVLAVALLLLLTTGFIMAWMTPKLRNPVILSTLLGLFVFFLMVYSS